MEGLIVFAHGARDPRWAEPFERIAARVRAQRSGLEVRLAFLELMTPTLEAAAAELIAIGCTQLAIVPVFLGQGAHVRRDLPELVERVRMAHPQVRIALEQAVGESDSVIDAIVRLCVAAAQGAE